MVQTDGSNQAADIFHSFCRKVYNWAFCFEEEFARRHYEAWTQQLAAETMLQPPPDHRITFDLQSEFERMGLASYQVPVPTEIEMCVQVPVQVCVQVRVHVCVQVPVQVCCYQ